jgi:hypothetical protein
LAATDVRAIFAGRLPVVFEIQLSTTYINVIAARRQFYLNEGAILVWIFGEFPDADRRLTLDDVFYNNNRNVFLVSERTRDASVAQRRLMLDCAHGRPGDDEDAAPLTRVMTGFDQPTIDRPGQRIFLFDFDGERSRLETEHLQLVMARQAPLRDAFESWFLAGMPEESTPGLPRWTQLRAAFRRKGVALPIYPRLLPKPLLKLLYSAKHGRVSGWNFKSLVDVCHYAVKNKGTLYRPFRRVLIAYDRGAQILAEDAKGKWAAKIGEIKEKLSEGDPQFAPDRSHDDLIDARVPLLVLVCARGRGTAVRSASRCRRALRSRMACSTMRAKPARPSTVACNSTRLRCRPKLQALLRAGSTAWPADGAGRRSGHLGVKADGGLLRRCPAP